MHALSVSFLSSQRTHYARQKAEDKLESISKEMSKSREREAALRDDASTVQARIEYLSIISITVLLTVSAWQMFYLKSFFRSKKLL